MTVAWAIISHACAIGVGALLVLRKRGNAPTNVYIDVNRDGSMRVLAYDDHGDGTEWKIAPEKVRSFIVCAAELLARKEQS